MIGAERGLADARTHCGRARRRQRLFAGVVAVAAHGAALLALLQWRAPPPPVPPEPVTVSLVSLPSPQPRPAGPAAAPVAR
ncbi:MAG: hypothetical protein WDM92_03470 [Caulobacteraceae bacterium]